MSTTALSTTCRNRTNPPERRRGRDRATAAGGRETAGREAAPGSDRGVRTGPAGDIGLPGEIGLPGDIGRAGAAERPAAGWPGDIGRVADLGRADEVGRAGETGWPGETEGPGEAGRPEERGFAGEIWWVGGAGRAGPLAPRSECSRLASTRQDGSLATVASGSGIQLSLACGQGSTAGGGRAEPSGRDRTVS